MTTRDIEALRGAVRGSVHLAGDEGYDAARSTWNLSVDLRPDAVVEPADDEDVAAAVRVAAAAGLRVAPVSTGHGAETLGPLGGAVLLRTGALDAVTIDPDARTATIGAGAVAADVAAAAAEHGLAPVLGLAPTVGVAGLALAGGTGWLSRAYGLAADQVRSLEVVTADGERLRADAGSEPELFWALRAGGGCLAVVTALELTLHPVEELSAGMLAWPAERTAEVLEEFRRWTWDAPETLTGVFRRLSLPDVDAIPAPLRGKQIVAVLACHLGPAADAERLIAPMRGGTLVDTFGPIGPAELVRVAGDPEQPTPARGDGWLLRSLEADVVDAVADLASSGGLDDLTVFELRQLGGAMSRLPGEVAVFTGGAAVDAASHARIVERIAALRERLAPWTADATPDADTLARLDRARQAYDPGRRFIGNRDAR